MAKARVAPVKTLKAIEKFIEAAKGELDVRKVVLFGSHASGRARRWSDIDIAVISNDFEGVELRERLKALGKIAWSQRVTEIDALGYTEAEFAVQDPLDLVAEIKEHGVVVYERP